MSANSSPDRNEKEEAKAFGSRRLMGDSTGTESITEIDGIRVLGLSADDIDFYTGFSAQRRKRLVRKVGDAAPHHETSSLAGHDCRIKIDIRLVPVLTILYLIAHIDRANIGNAKIEGLIEDLGLTGTQYNVALAIFFPPCLYHSCPATVARF